MMQLIDVKPGMKFQLDILKEILPNVETALFFGQVFDLRAEEMSDLLLKLFKSDLSQALLGEGGTHSHELQDYIIELGYQPEFEAGAISLSTDPPPHGEILPEVWKSLRVEVAQSIKDVGFKLGDMIQGMAGKEGQMLFKSMMTMNAKRPIIGDYKAVIQHERQLPHLVIMDDSGSMTEHTVKAILEDTVALGYMANAHFARVSNTCTWWEPGTYRVDNILAVSEFGGTQYEHLAPLFDGQHWGTVVTIADYDSSPAAKTELARCTGSIEQVLDISLVDTPTYLSECVGQLAKETRSVLVAANNTCCMRRW